MQLAARTPSVARSLSPTPRTAVLKADLTQALRLLQRSDAVRAFMLDVSPRVADADVAMLVAPRRPAFTITTEEEQVGALPGRIALRYLGVPAFSDRAGLSGGAVVTSYKARTHPLHAPAVMADVRVGRYVRDNDTGEWCIITRNGRDRVTRLQYVRVTDALSRERICLTCSSELFDRGDFLASVLFQCHDREWRACPLCNAPPAAGCGCAMRERHGGMPVGLAGAAETVMREGSASWVGKVRVTVVSNLTRSRLLDIDEYMDVRASYEPAMDAALAANMQRLAIHEKVTSAACVPAPILDGGREEIPAFFGGAGGTCRPVEVEEEEQERQEGEQGEGSESSTTPDNDHHREHVGRYMDDVLAEPQFAAAGLSCLLHNSATVASEGGALDMDGTEEEEADEADFDLKELDLPLLSATVRDPFEELFESAMLPADPSTLPGGIDLCMDGMGLGEDAWYSSFMAQDKPLSPVTSSPKSSTTAPPEHVPEMQVNLNGLPFEQKPAQLTVHVQAAQPVAPHQVRPDMVMAKREDELHVEQAECKMEGAPRGRPLAPRPEGMSVGAAAAAAAADGFIWQMGAVSNDAAYVVAAHQARLDAMEKERKAEERRKKNRQAAARSNARKKLMMDGIKSRIKESKERATKLRKQQMALRKENSELKRQIEMSK